MASLCLSSHVLRFLDFRDLHIARTVCWDWYSVFGGRDVEKQCARQHGLPNQLRFRFWMYQSQALVLQEEGGGLATYRRCLAKSKLRTSSSNESTWFLLSQQPGLEGEIARDVTRTFPQRVLFRVKNGLGREMLFNILIALAVHEPKVGYCQGMNFVVAVALTVALQYHVPSYNKDELALATHGIPRETQEWIECDVFWLMTAFLNRFDMRELWRPGVPQLKLRIYQFDRLISNKLPTLHTHFRSIGLAPDFFASQWFLTLMSYNMDFHQLLRVWDILILEGWKTIFKTGLAILRACEKDILNMTLEQLSTFFRHSNAMYLQDNASLSQAFNVKISTRELADLESDYITQILFEKPSTKKPEHSDKTQSKAVFVDEEVFVDHRLASVFKEEIEHLDSDVRNDFQYLRAKIEEAERMTTVKEEALQALAKEYMEVKLTLDELKRTKKVASEQLYDLTTQTRMEEDYLMYLEKIESIEARICAVTKKVEQALWKTSQAQVELEEIVEKKNAFSHQLRAVLEQNKQLKSQAVKSLWSQLNFSSS